MNRKPAGIILSAGESRRMGRDKALLEYRRTTFLGRIIAVLEPRVEPLVVVLGHHAEAIRQAVPSGPRVVVNTNYQAGMLTSLQTGIRELPCDTEAALFTLVDHPAVAEETVELLIGEWAKARPLIAIPRRGVRRGHPVIVNRQVLDEILALGPESSAKDVIRSHRDRTLFVDVDDAGVLCDIDLPEQYERLR
ncbi:MAG: nucleotidyltransferase family protein [Acidobacteriia bacterium]|nr:nucleotidyltransferase family protein [Terriglobia bacterium]